jgi:tetratricopeptide (TPR) repeat protein
MFKHALTQEVAYQSLLIERRKQIHEAAGEALESMYAEQLDDHLSELAHHFSRSNNPSKAIEYLRRASEQAIERSANAEAIAQLTAAIELLRKLPDDSARKREETSFQLALGGVLAIATTPGNPDVESAFSRARELSMQTKDDWQLFHALAGLWYRHQVWGQTVEALEEGEELLSLARRAADPVRLRFAHFALAQGLMLWGDVASAVEHIGQGEDIICPETRVTSYHIGDAPSRWLAISSVTFWLAGYPDQALTRSLEALAAADKLSHGYVSAVTRLFCGHFCVNSRRIQDVLRHADAAIPPSLEYGFLTLFPSMMIQRGWALVHAGKVKEGFEQIERGMVINPWMLRYSRLRGHACLQAKRPEDVLHAVEEGVQMLNGATQHIEAAELYRVKGELLLLQNAGALSEAEACYRDAVEIARRQHAKSWELRATMSLARLLRDTNRREEARMMLAQIYNWFTEGFDTPDLKDAKALLDELHN